MSLCRFLPMLLVMGTIFFLSDQPGDSLELPGFFAADKLAHAGAYGVLAWATLFAVVGRWGWRRVPVLAVVVVCGLYGLSDELHQAWVPYRSPELADLAADLAGVLLAVAGWRYWSRRDGGAAGGGKASR
ncbi:MAG: VanZ family protein [Thermodesulfobacteriota bacterium]